MLLFISAIGTPAHASRTCSESSLIICFCLSTTAHQLSLERIISQEQILILVVSSLDLIREKPIRSWLEGRETLFPRPKLVTSFTKHIVQPIELPAGITREDAVEAIAGTTWARGIAQGIADKGGLSGSARDDFILRFARQVSEGIVSSSYLPAIITPAPRGPGRPPKTPESRGAVRVGKEISREELEKGRR